MTNLVLLTRPLFFDPPRLFQAVLKQLNSI